MVQNGTVAVGTSATLVCTTTQLRTVVVVVDIGAAWFGDSEVTTGDGIKVPGGEPTALPVSGSLYAVTTSGPQDVSYLLSYDTEA